MTDTRARDVQLPSLGVAGLRNLVLNDHDEGVAVLNHRVKDLQAVGLRDNDVLAERLIRSQKDRDDRHLILGVALGPHGPALGVEDGHGQLMQTTARSRSR
jgi:hypothetical protein